MSSLPMKEKPMGFCEPLLAHPDETLKEHLIQVSKLSEEYAPNDLKELARVAGLFHDIGKATTFFQKHLKDPSYKIPETNHSYFSSVFAAWALMEKKYNESDAFTVFMAISRHHGNLKSPEKILPTEDEAKSRNFLSISEEVKPGLRKQLKAIEKQIEDLKQSDCLKQLCTDMGMGDLKLENFFEGGWKETLIAIYNHYRTLRRKKERTYYWKVNEIFSCLIDADKKLSAGVSPKERSTLPESMVDVYLKTVRKEADAEKNILEMREILYNSVNEKILNDPLKYLFPSHLTITAPTGSGKTLTGFNAALKLRKRVAKEYGYEPKIIYALPYINLIEQNYDVIKKVLETGRLNPRDYLLAHHHLAKISEMGDEDSKSVEEQLMFMESWDSEIVVTTFVQLFQTLVAASNRSLKKLHNIRKSIIILDEIQSIDAEHWNLIRDILKDIKERETTIISMTATQPKLISGIELAPRTGKITPEKRVGVQYTPDSIDLKQLKEKIVESDAQSILVVVNTIENSILLHKKLLDEKKHDGWRIFYLSTNITPYERRERLKKLEEALERKEGKTVLISTQVVEAGVDLDFEEGFREISPIDSILQVAGRINRNGKHLGTLHIFSLDDGKEKAVYGEILPFISQNMLKEMFSKERGVSDVSLIGKLSNYYESIEEWISHQKSEEILNSISKLDYDQIEKFSLIKNAPTERIFVELDDNATEVLNRLREYLKLEDWKLKRLKVRALLPEIEAYTINVREKRIKRKMPRLFSDDPAIEREDIFHISKEMVREYYDIGKQQIDGTRIDGSGFKFLEDIEDQFT